MMNTLFDLTQYTTESVCDDGMTKLYDALEFVNHNAALFADSDTVAKLAQLLQVGYARLRWAKARPGRVEAFEEAQNLTEAA